MTSTFTFPFFHSHNQSPPQCNLKKKKKDMYKTGTFNGLGENCRLYFWLMKDMATHSSILAWRIPRTEEPGGLQSMGLQRVGHD